jgi:hypothetical protein
MTNIIFLVGLFISLSVCYALFAYTIGEMHSNNKND